MSIFDSLNAFPNARPTQQMSVGNPMQMIQQLRQNPAAMLKQAGMTIPDGMSNPQQIVQHLVQSGQVSNTRLQSVMQMMGRR